MKKRKLQLRLNEVRTRRSAVELTINRDWIQAQLLAGVARSAALRQTLIFKGGTALQKVFFGEGYRFSEDLDFTAIKNAPKRDVLKCVFRPS